MIFPDRALLDSAQISCAQKHCERDGRYFCILRKVPLQFMKFARKSPSADGGDVGLAFSMSSKTLQLVVLGA
jgi:hypothetical protein